MRAYSTIWYILRYNTILYDLENYATIRLERLQYDLENYDTIWEDMMKYDTI